MLTTTILLPSTFAPAGGDATALADQALALSLLRDLEDAALVLYAGETYVPAVRRALASWSPKHADRAVRLLTQMAKRRRFIEVKSPLRRSCPCGGCSGGLDAAEFGDVVAMLCNGSCCGEAPATVPEVVPLSDYPVSKLNDRMQSLKSREFGPGELSQEQFERVVLVPLLRHAKRLVLYDRNIAPATAEMATPCVPARYAETIHWIAGVVARYAFNRPEMVVLTGWSTRPGQAGIEETRDALARTAERIAADTQIDVRFRVVVESDPSVTAGDATMRHGRYISTDQVTVLLERGFDLLLPPQRGSKERRIRDFAISRLPGASPLETHIARLSVMSMDG